MNIVCLDMEGVLVPEIWIAFSKASGIPELKRTTRDEPDYNKLMKWRLGILKEHGLGLKEIQDVIATIDPLPGAKEFLDELRTQTQVIILSDTFTQFAKPLMKKLGWPTIFCNTLEVAEDGEVTGFKMRVEQSKLSTVKALQSIGYETIAAGDSYNDLGMIRASKAGFLFKSTEKIIADNPDLRAFEEFGDLLAAIKGALDPFNWRRGMRRRLKLQLGRGMRPRDVQEFDKREKRCCNDATDTGYVSGCLPAGISGRTGGRHRRGRGTDLPARLSDRRSTDPYGDRYQ